MPLLLVRHASAGDRTTWEGDDRERPLDDRGRRDADELVEQLASFHVQAILTSPYRRCVETVRTARSSPRPRDRRAGGAGRGAAGRARDRPRSLARRTGCRRVRARRPRLGRIRGAEMEERGRVRARPGARAARGSQAAARRSLSSRKAPSRTPPRTTRNGVARRDCSSVRITAPAGRVPTRSASMPKRRTSSDAGVSASSASARSRSSRPRLPPTMRLSARALPPTASARRGSGGSSSST